MNEVSALMDERQLLGQINERVVLVVNGDPAELESLSELISIKYRTLQATNADEALRLATSELPDVILIDSASQFVDEIACCARLRSSQVVRQIPIVLLVDPSDQDRRLQAFESGADDVILKPCRTKELFVRLQAKMRREAERIARAAELQCGNLAINSSRMLVTVQGRHVALSVLEFRLLRYFVMNRGTVLSRQKILNAVWGNVVVTDRTVDTHVVSLRKKIRECSHKINTVFGAGYVFELQP
ncbi:MAG: hypothetical protein A2428_01810 [Bdellovibrionales bacterium RIFOXYC1_FULL_54_43]|nr:MAG: hypothetical protein A2428_01810 [Bdellovibrionales bacterium RIFOXYC1_FULL_54_43]OFZ81675.1 MAG: hypothetical protein A2603_12020 [Bdellovibrionales bacterium RIFOXYD1_FULL_55_31]